MKKIKKKAVKPILHEQWIEVTVVDGKTISTYYPPNKEFERERLDRDPAPTLIYRRINFVHGVPMEYNWVSPSPEFKQYGGIFLHRFKVEDWPKVMFAEQASEHVIPSDKPQPRPEAFGPCPCAECTKEREAKWALHP